MITGTVFTLFVVPSSYLLLAPTWGAESAPERARDEVAVAGGVLDPA